MTVSKFTGMPSLEFHETECFSWNVIAKKTCIKKTLENYQEYMAMPK